LAPDTKQAPPQGDTRGNSPTGGTTKKDTEQTSPTMNNPADGNGTSKKKENIGPMKSDQQQRTQTPQGTREKSGPAKKEQVGTNGTAKKKEYTGSPKNNQPQSNQNPQGSQEKSGSSTGGRATAGDATSQTKNTKPGNAASQSKGGTTSGTESGN
jgi:hypothetical protein